ncbi:MAG: PTS cellobiose transporter subunit IIC [Nitrospinaceae bacterium]|nr:MAG: PTS cellobiose transporter subunit IIC [Nitrospinaceae bacterium]
MCLQRILIAIFCFFLAFNVAWSFAHANEPEIQLILKNEVSLKNLHAIAFDRNPGLKAAKAKWKAVIERYPQVTALDDPEIGIDTWNIPTDFDLDETRNTIYWISQKFPFPGKLKIEGDIVSQDVKVARTQFEIATRDLLAELEIGYHELLYMDRAIHIIRSNKKLAEHLAKISATHYSAHATTLNDVLKAQSQLAQLDNDLILLIELRSNEVAHINALLDLPPAQPIGKPRDVPYVPFNLELNQMYEMVREYQQELHINGFEMEKSRHKIRLAEKKYYPDFRTSFKWFENNRINLDQGLGVFVGINVPIWLGKNRARVSEAQNNLQALEYEKKDLQNRAFAEINKIYFKIQNSSRLVRLYKESLIPQALQSLDLAETWHKQNKGSFAGLLEARSTWLNFQLAYQRGLADYFQHIARMEKLIGVNLEIAKNKENKK